MYNPLVKAQLQLWFQGCSRKELQIYLEISRAAVSSAAAADTRTIVVYSMPMANWNITCNGSQMYLNVYYYLYLNANS